MQLSAALSRRSAIFYFSLAVSLCASSVPCALVRAQDGTAAPSPEAPTAAPPAEAGQPARAKKPWREAMERAPEPVASDTQSQNRTWYGWQTLIADGMSLAVVLAFRTNLGIAVTFGGLTLGTPIVHFGNENFSDGLLSLAIRAGISGIIVGSAVVAVEVGGGDLSGTPANVAQILAVTAMAGMLAMICVDAAVLAFTNPAKPADGSHSALVPWVEPQRGNYGLRFVLAL
jgi:hypothetical protein